MDKLKSLWHKWGVKAMCMVATMSCLVCTAFAADSPSSDSTQMEVTWTTLSPIWDKINDTLNPQALVNVLAGAAGAAVTLVFLWWGIRKVTRMIMGAFQKGRFSV